MSNRLIWLPEVLLGAGLKVACCPGWETRGSDPPGPMKGVLLHHTAGPKTGNMPSLAVIRDGRPAIPASASKPAIPALKGPLSQLGLGRDGTYYVVGSGRANHAGAGRWHLITSGNSEMIGIEAENTGLVSDPWPEIQMQAYRQGVAAILMYLGLNPAVACAGHKEYALPNGRKIDPLFNMGDFRLAVSGLMRDEVPRLVLIPAVDTKNRVTLRRGSTHEQVRELDALLNVAPDGVFDASTEAAVRLFQTARGLVPDGIVGPKTWAALDAA